MDKYNLEELKKLKLKADDLYYNTGESIMSDTEYDLLKEEIQKRDSGYKPGVGAKLREGENRVRLPYWLGSADKITDTDKLDRWLTENKAHSYILSEKLDGVSCLLVFKNGKLNMYTRGDGTVGADISYLAPYLSLPKLKGDITVRGELIMKKSTFQNKYAKQYRNARNMVSGLIGAKVARAGLEDISLVVYEIVGDSMPPPSIQLAKLKTYGFEVVKYEIAKKIDIDILSTVLPAFKADSHYEIDGIIVHANNEYDRNTDGNPSYLFAFKMTFLDAIHEVNVLDIEWNVSKWGQIKPVAIIEPLELSDVTISRATAHNAKYVVENSLGPGAIIKVTRSKDVIPYIVEVVVQAEEPKMPAVDYVWDKNRVNIMTKEEDNTMCIKIVADFFAKLGIKHVSEATVAKMYANGLDNLMKIIGANKERFLQVPEFQEKSAERIYTNIRNGLKSVKMSTIIGASGVLGYGIGVKRVETLLQAIPDLLELHRTKTRGELLQIITGIEGFSDLTAEKIIDNLPYASKFVERMKQYTTIEEQVKISSSLQGKKFVMTGFRDKKLEEDIAQRGGKVTSTVSKATSIVIVAQKTDKLTGKLEKASELGIPILTKTEFIRKYIT
jgi:DNA ligase (NAD+)